MQLSSPAFHNGGIIPEKYTCEGEDTSPPLSWNGIPNNAKSLVLMVVDPDAPDPDAPQMTWVHWLLYNLPPNSAGLSENADGALPNGTASGVNDWRHLSYGGPCPPIGVHRYFFKLYALDFKLPDLHHPNMKKLEQSMRGHVLATAELMGTYQKNA